MNRPYRINRAMRAALMTGAAVAAVGYGSTASAAKANAPAKLGKVTVTGTRIRRSNIETAQPITRISRQQIEQSGYTNIGQLLGQLSFAGGHANTSNNGTTTEVNLRNLGANRNLVLVNGKRWMQGLGSTTNLDTIPTSIIDHIEILQDGASAVYGSDAIAGVVNIITVKNFNGTEAHAHYSIQNGDGRWDGQVKQYDFTVGSGNDRGNVVFSATYRKQNPITRGARKLTRYPIAGLTSGIGGIEYTPQGRFRLFGPAVSGKKFGRGTCDTYDPSNPTNALCDLTLQNAPTKPSLQNFRNYKLSDEYNHTKQLYLQTPLKDVNLYAQGHYDLLDNVTLTANAAYTRDEAVTHASKDPLQIGFNSPKTANGQTISIAKTNPYNPFGKNLVASSTDPCLAAGKCIGLSTLSRIPLEAAYRGTDLNRDYFHIFVGFDGYVNIFDREVDWDVGFAQNRVQDTSRRNGVFNTARIAKALGPASKCTDPCVPLNYFGGSAVGYGGSITRDQLDYIKYEPHNFSQSNLRDWTADLSSDVYNLPAGPLGIAIGYERVDNYGFTHPDSVVVNGNDTDSTGSPLDGRVVRNAEYAEINLPLLADRPGVKRLSLDIANRWTQFKRSGGTTGQHAESFVHNSSGRLNIRYQVINDLLLRASWSQGFRSPNETELFSGQSHPFINIYDPCAGGTYGGYRGGRLPPNCPNGTEDEQYHAEQYTTSGSNPKLQPEKSISRTVGFVYSPSQMPGLDINADYFKIEINNAVGTVGVQNIINGCFKNFSFCNLTETSGNQIENVLNINTNVGALLTEGIDVGLHYKFPSTSIGDFDARLDGTFLKTFDQTTVNAATKTGFSTSHLAGVDPRPKRRFNGYLDWDYGNWSAHYHIEYIGESVSQCGVGPSIKPGYCSLPNETVGYQGAPGQFSFGRNHIGSTAYHDVQVAYTLPSLNTAFTVGVNNLFDKKPPITGGTGSLGAGSFDLSLYRLPSRVVYGDLRVRF